MVKRLGHGVYEVDGYMIDVLNTSAEEHKRKLSYMLKEEYVKYSVAISVANYYSGLDHVDPDVVDLPCDLTEERVREVAYDIASELYDAKYGVC